MIGSLGAPTIASILEERASRGLFACIEDFARRVRFDRTEAEALCGSGALDSLAETGEACGARRSDILMRLLCVCASREGAGAGIRNAEFSFDGERTDSRAVFRRGLRGQADSPAKLLDAQMRYLGTTLAVHPPVSLSGPSPSPVPGISPATCPVSWAGSSTSWAGPSPPSLS